MNAENLVGLGPGAPARRFDDYDAAVLIPAGSYLIINMHYTTKGTETPDQTGDESSTNAGNLTIPPADASASGHGSVTFAKAVTLASLNPHMHLRGKNNLRGAPPVRAAN